MHADLLKTDRAAMECIDPERSGQDRDNWVWIREAEKNRLVVGTQARILYQDAEGLSLIHILICMVPISSTKETVP